MKIRKGLMLAALSMLAGAVVAGPGPGPGSGGGSGGGGAGAPTAMGPQGAGQMDQDRDRDRVHSSTGTKEPIYGRELMTKQERQAYRTRLEGTPSDAERAQIRNEHRTMIQARARDRGVAVPPDSTQGKGKDT